MEEADARRRSLEAHLEVYLGAPTWRWSEAAPGAVPVELLVHEPTAQRPWYAVVTAGMSYRPMAGARGLGIPPYAEVYLALADLDRGAAMNFWPLLLLRVAPQYAHQYEAPLAPYHTLSLSDPPEPFAPDTGLCAAMLARPALMAPEFAHVAVPGAEGTAIHAMVPLHGDEFTLVRERGSAPLLDLFHGAGVTELLDPGRPSVLAGHPE
jgi:hypothetical protein